MKLPDKEAEKQAAAARLRKAVELAGHGNASETARRFQWTVPTFLSHCNGSRGFDTAAGKIYAARLQVRSAWLLSGAGEPKGPGIDDRLMALNNPEIAETLSRSFKTTIEAFNRNSGK